MKGLILGTRPGCTGCDYAKKNGKVQRWFDQEAWQWKYYRRCNWCRNCYTANEEEYQEYIMEART